MVFNNLAHLCSHLNNVSKARLALTSVPNSKMHVKLLLAFQREGLISSVIRAGRAPPPSHLLLGHPTMEEIDGVPSIEPVTQSNIATRRLWLGLKYWQNEPVLGHLSAVSKAKRKISLDTTGLRRVLRGERSGPVQGLRSPGECLFLITDLGLMESRECLEKNVGGLALVRVN